MKLTRICICASRLTDTFFKRSVTQMKRLVITSFVLIGLMAPSTAHAAGFNNCAALNKTYPNGVAKNQITAKKQSALPKVSASIYKSNIKLDIDKDGTVCEKVANPNGVNPLGGSAPEDFLMPNVVCMNLQAAQDLIQDHGVFLSRSKDASGRNRSQLIDRNWIVIKQSPAPGKKIAEGDAMLSAVKIGESTGGICK
jgi:hypothetical protein